MALLFEGQWPKKTKNVPSWGKAFWYKKVRKFWRFIQKHIDIMAWAQTESHPEQVRFWNLCKHDILIWIPVLKDQRRFRKQFEKVVREASFTSLARNVESLSSFFDQDYSHFQSCFRRLHIFVSFSFPLKSSFRFVNFICVVWKSIFRWNGPICNMFLKVWNVIVQGNGLTNPQFSEKEWRDWWFRKHF